MAFTDLLRSARRSPTAAFLQFKLAVDRGEGGVHVFVEGRGDRSFYVGFITNRLGGDRTLYVYECGRKSEVYRSFQLAQKDPREVDALLFFVDKDLSDLLNEDYPEDNRIFVTEHYSIENYLVSRRLFERVLNELVRITGMTVHVAPILHHFDEELARFHFMVRGIMAWVLFSIEDGRRPNLSNLNLSYLFKFDEDGRLVRQKTGRARNRLGYLDRVSGVETPSGAWRDLARTARRFRNLPPKSWVRGKFEAWFFIKYLDLVMRDLRVVAREAGGSAVMRTIVHSESFVELLAPRLPEPEPLGQFLAIHL